MQDEVSHFFTLLGHPLRRKIIQYLGDSDWGGFTDLSSYLGVSTGTIYYQLDLLVDLLEQDKDKKYHLNEKGRFAYKLLIESDERLSSSRFVTRNASLINYVTFLVIGWRLISRLYGLSRLAIVFTVIVIIYGTLVTSLSGLYPLVLIYVDRLPVPQIYIPVLFISGYLLINILANLTSYLVYRAKDGVKNLFVGSAFSLLPILILPTIHLVANYLNSPLSSLQAQVIMLIGLGYSLCFLTSAISLSKGLSAAKAALPASVTLYVSLGIAFILTTL